VNWRQPVFLEADFAYWYDILTTKIPYSATVTLYDGTVLPSGPHADWANPDETNEWVDSDVLKDALVQQMVLAGPQHHVLAFSAYYRSEDLLEAVRGRGNDAVVAAAEQFLLADKQYQTRLRTAFNAAAAAEIRRVEHAADELLATFTRDVRTWAHETYATRAAAHKYVPRVEPSLPAAGLYQRIMKGVVAEAGKREQAAADAADLLPIPEVSVGVNTNSRTGITNVVVDLSHWVGQTGVQTFTLDGVHVKVVLPPAPAA
jgi:hypothetical protein